MPKRKQQPQAELVPAEPSEYLSLEQAAVELGISVGSVMRLMRRGLLQSWTRPFGKRRTFFKRADIADLKELKPTDRAA